MKFTPMRAAVVAGLSLALVGAAAAPALAAPMQTRVLPGGYSLYALDCDNLANQLYSLDTSNAQATPIGTGTHGGDPESTSEGCAGPSAYDPSTGKVFYIDWSSNPETIRAIDLRTGDSIAGPAFSFDGAPIYTDSMAIGLDGSAYILTDSGPNRSDSLYSLDIQTGELTLIGLIGDGEESFYAFSVDPTSGKFYVIDTDGVVSELDVTTGALTEIGTGAFGDVPEDDNSVWSLAIDANGTFWIENDGEDADLWSATLPTLGTGEEFSGVIATDVTDPATQFYTESIFIAPTPVDPTPVTPVVPPADPTLAETGVNDAATIALAGSAALALLAGAGALIATRARRKARA